MSSPGTSSVMTESHSTVGSGRGPHHPVRALVVHDVTLSMFSMNSGRLRKSRQKS